MAYGEYIAGIDSLERRRKAEEDKRRLADIQGKYGNMGLDVKDIYGEFQNKYQTDPEGAFTYFEGELGKRAQEKKAQQEQQTRMAGQQAYAGLSSPVDTGYAEKLRGYQIDLDLLKNRLAGLAIPANFFSERIGRLEKPFALYEGGSLERLRQEEQVIADNLKRYLYQNYGIPMDITRNMGWEELLKELIKIAKGR